MRRMGTACFALGLALMGAQAGFADTLLNEGSPTTNFTYDQDISSGTDFYMYTDFKVPAGQTWNVSAMYDYLGVDAQATITGFYWELRSGMNGSNGGTLLGFGSVPDGPEISRTAVAGLVLNGGNSPVYQYTVAVSNRALTNLTSGQTYWFALVPKSTGYNIWLPVTDHAGAVNSLEDNFSEEYYYNWANPSGFYSDVPASTHDYATGLLGVSVSAVPEPSSFVLLGTALLGLALISLRRTKQILKTASR